MVSLSAKSVIANSSNLYPINYPQFPFQIPRVRFKISSRKSNLEDFQTYTKPSRLLPATEVKFFSESFEKKIFSAIIGEPWSFYKVNLRTSNSYGSALTDIYAGLLICLIDENNESILQRISASSVNDHVRKSEESSSADTEMLHFQRGSVDRFVFSGPMLAKIKAIWIGIESGQWRLGGLSLTVAPQQFSVEGTVEKRINCMGLQYDFEVDDILLGESSENSMVELKPCRITELSGTDPFTILNEDLQYPSLENQVISNEESMREYTDLKFSLLLYDALLISIGTSIAEFSSGDGAAFSFLFGGACGFLYLLLLQRSVDELPAAGSTPPLTERNFQEMFTGFKSPVTVLALAIGITVLALKNGSRDVPLELTPRDVIVGMMGFLACKVSVVLAAFKPVPLDRKTFK